MGAPEADSVRNEAASDDPIRTALSDESVAAQLRAALEAFPEPVCTRCVGRLVSKADKTRDNVAIGTVATTALAYDAKPTDDPDCPWCEGLFQELDHFTRLVCSATEPYQFESILLATKVHPDIQDLERVIEPHLSEPVTEWYEPMKTELNREIGALVLPRLGTVVDFDRADLVVMLDPYFDQTEVETSHVYLAGRYRKYDRTIPQTQWPCNRCHGKRPDCKQCKGTGQQYGTSVQGLFEETALPAFGAKEGAFHGGGREDIDALMLGTGRPFVLEVKRPQVRVPHDTNEQGTITPGQSPYDLAELAQRINAHAMPRAEVEGLRFTDKKEVAAVKGAALDKAYRAHVVAEGPIARQDLDVAVDTVTCAVIKQRTPQRVAHRRADKVRERTVRSVQIAAWGRHVRHESELANDPGLGGAEADAPDDQAVTEFTLDISAESGTYIKELVHGDEGRTEPSFAALLGVAMRVQALDVVGVGTDGPVQ